MNTFDHFKEMGLIYIRVALQIKRAFAEHLIVAEDFEGYLVLGSLVPACLSNNFHYKNLSFRFEWVEDFKIVDTPEKRHKYSLQID